MRAIAMQQSSQNRCSCFRLIYSVRGLKGSFYNLNHSTTNKFLNKNRLLRFYELKGLLIKVFSNFHRSSLRHRTASKVQYLKVLSCDRLCKEIFSWSTHDEILLFDDSKSKILLLSLHDLCSLSTKRVAL